MLDKLFPEPSVMGVLDFLALAAGITIGSLIFAGPMEAIEEGLMNKSGKGLLG
tara:strand:- start:104 stop:262 length:159 start_codon:yes stop_codon:yes gene_type:complete